MKDRSLRQLQVLTPKSFQSSPIRSSWRSLRPAAQQS
ncbi:hypothetical protein OKW11_004014 [Pseudomonas baetica]|nr:hypothetical protein [Pseudomonas baetica]